MKDFLNKYFSKELLERYWLSATLVWTLSILYWIIYQYNSLSYTELSFFSWTQSIDDWVKILPVTISMFLFWFVWYEIILKIFSFISFIDNKIKNKLILNIINITIQLVISIWWTGILYHYKEKFTGNVLWSLFLWLSSFLSVIFVFSVFYLMHLIFTYTKDEWKISWNEWIKQNASKVIFIITFLTLLNSFSLTFNANQTIDKHNCFIHEWKIFQLKYMNDKYIFTDVYTWESEIWSNYKPHYTLVFENKETDFVLWFQSCEEIDKNNTHYIKKDGRCIEVLSYDKDYQYLQTKEWLIKNNWYDLYLTWYCISDKIKNN